MTNSFIVTTVVLLATATLFAGDPQQVCNCTDDQVVAKITIAAGKYERINTPVSVTLTGCTKNLRLVEIKDNKKIKVPSQIDCGRCGKKKELWWILSGHTPAGTTRTFKLVKKKNASTKSPFTVKDIDDKQLLVKNKNRPVLQYNYGLIQATPGKADHYDRSAYIHPIWTPNGHVITGNYSPEHVHQRGLFFAWRKVNFNDTATGFWSLGEATGRIWTDEPAPKVKTGPVFAEIAVNNKGVVKDKTLMKEKMTIRIFDLGENDAWLFDLHFSQKPIEGQTMELPQIKYGAMAFRGTGKWLDRDSKEVIKAVGRGIDISSFEEFMPEGVKIDVLTDTGKDRYASNKTKGGWIDYTGPLGKNNKDWGGLATFDYPSNLRHPQPLRVHPDMPYFCYCPVQNAPYTITADKPLKSSYRFLVHNGHPEKELNERLARDLSDPPKVTLLKK